MIQVPASFSCRTVICVIEKRRLLETYTTNRPYMSLDNNQEVLFYQNPVSNLFLTRGLNETTIFRPSKLMDYISIDEGKAKN